MTTDTWSLLLLFSFIKCVFFSNMYKFYSEWKSRSSFVICSHSFMHYLIVWYHKWNSLTVCIMSAHTHTASVQWVMNEHCHDDGNYVVEDNFTILFTRCNSYLLLFEYLIDPWCQMQVKWYLKKWICCLSVVCMSW